MWFGIVGLEPGALGACPAHGLNAVTAQLAMASHDASSGHAMHDMAAPAGDHGSAPASQHHHQCTCPDCGCCAGLISAPVATTIPVPEAVLAAVREVSYVSVRPVWVDFVLPYPTAPPADLSV